MRSVTIFGCGWVGRALRDALKPTFKVYCIVKSNLQDRSDYCLDDILQGNLELFRADSIVISIPAKGDYLKTLEQISTLLNPKSQIILLSSTSIYPKVSRYFSESSKELEQNLIFYAERYLKAKFKDIVILRLGGLMGYDRVCGRYTANKKIDNCKVNYIHRDDAVAIIKRVIEQNIRAKIYNLVAPMHPLHLEVSSKNAKKFGFGATKYSNLEPLNRVVLSNKVVNELNYTFKKPNPLEFWD